MSPRSPLILVIDDEDANRYVATHHLERAGFTPLSAATGTAGLAVVADRKPDLVLLDMNLPDMDGLAVCRQIKAASPRVLILQTSAARLAREDRVAGLEGGADGYLAAPFEPEELIATIRALLRTRQAEEAVIGLNRTLERRVIERTEELEAAKRQLELELESRRRTEQVLQQAQKMEAVGRLTGAIAHDFNNLLTVIAGNLGLLSEVDDMDPRSRRLISAATEAADRCGRIVAQLLSFSRQEVRRETAIDANATIEAFLGLARQAVGETVTLVSRPHRDLWRCMVDRAQFETAILNLLLNSRDAMPSGGEVTISTANVVFRSGHPSGAAPGEYVEVAVTDTGCGMPDEVREHAFEPFFTTKPVGAGTGLGLSQVYGFATRHDGAVELTSAPGSGTIVSLYLPRSLAEVQSAERDSPPVAKCDGTVLLVEDDPLVRSTAVAMLQELGLRVIPADGGQQALQLLTDAEVDLLFSDIVMAGEIDGVGLARKVRTARPEIGILLTTGFGAGFLNGPNDEFTVLRKPYNRAQLVEALSPFLAEGTRLRRG